MRKVAFKLVLALVALLMGGTAGGYWLVHAVAQWPMDAADSAQLEWTVPQGASVNRVGVLLERDGLIHNAWVWRIYVTLHRPDMPKAGRHKVARSMDVPALLRALAEKPLADEAPLTMVEGWRLKDADAFLAQAKLIEPGAYLKAAQDPKRFRIPFALAADTLEGYLFPDTYMVPLGPLDVDKLIQRQMDAFHARFVQPNTNEISRCGRTLHQLVIVASMLEREEPMPEQRSMVAGVMYKRLDANKPLGVDATSRYRLEEWNDRRAFLAALRNPDDPYNSRLRSGLPPSPIGAPGLPSLLAALRPTASAYWYYLHDAQRRVHFSRTAEEHEEYRKRYNVY